ncbi:Serine-aspartate repeat-containing protein D precursor [Roseimaritima ulvae]|uniref:Serine-aspartate repeat-containing protein D n=2 Tax=Roseimaritima ulvae TaxID=980254 RepID=A0A5B9QSZ5_9BACT|nr:Serine-aspartate repeat-containing protein D precursor [Roseimaritima ulvae]
MVRRSMLAEPLEPRVLMAADPIHVGVVYIETDYLESDADVGSDSQPDRFILSFTGGAEGTELTEFRINTDKAGDGLSIGDPMFDTEQGGRGKRGSHGFEVFKVVSDDAVQVEATVEDGGQELVIHLEGFHAGDRLEFTLDVDEILSNASDLETFNRKLDVINSGQEFEDSILDATFEAPHFETAHADALFLNEFGDPGSQYGLDLPADESDDVDSRPNRTAAAVASATQTPKPISIAGTVWVDSDLDLLRDANEEGLAGVQLTLLQLEPVTGQFVDTGFRATTDGLGRYQFDTDLGLMPGTFRVVQTQPDGYFSVGSVPGFIDGSSVGSSLSADILTGILIPKGDQHAVQYDFAEAAPASVSGFVYRDDSDDGIRDASEPGIGNIRIRLIPENTLGSQATLIQTTDANGFYRFENLSPGQYRIEQIDQPSDLSDGLDTAGTVNGIVVGAANNPGDSIDAVVLAGSQQGLEYNFGELPLGSISGMVYLLGPGEVCDGYDPGVDQPLPGVRIVLQNDLGETITETVTDADGQYRFDQLPKGNYTVVEFTPAGLLDGMAMPGRIGNVTVGDGVGGGRIERLLLTAGAEAVEYDFCEAAPASVSGYVYHDRDDDGQRDSGEEAIADVIIELVDGNGTVVDTTRTAADGSYRFEDVLPGTYSIRETQPDGYYDGIDTAGRVDGQPTGVAENPGDVIGLVALRQGQAGVEYNFGELRPASLSGMVHADTNQNCIADPGEELLSGVVIQLYDRDGNRVAETQTDVNGRYRFENLVPGRYTVIELQPEGYFEGGQMAGSAGGDDSQVNRIADVDLGSGEVAVEYNFCEHPPAEISGVVFADRDEDCVFDANELPIASVRVDLLDGAGQVVATTTTDANGRYTFSHLPAGVYTVRETQPMGYLHGGQRAGSAGGNDSVADIISGIPIGFGDRLTDYNFCELEPSSLSGFVYVDRDADCVFDNDEPPLAGVEVQLLNEAGEIVARTTTDADGNYRFQNLRPGQYSVRELQPAGYFQGGQQVGSGGGIVLGDDHLGQINLGPGQTLVDYNFCELEPSSLGGVVYVDRDADCVRDTDEPPLAGVEVQLLNDAGQIVARTHTNAAGQYRFDNLAPGRYSVREVQPEGYYQGGQMVGDGGGEVLGDDHLGNIDIGPGQTLSHYDFCELEGGSLSGRVWSETDLDQTFDDDDNPIAGVVVELIDANGSVVQRTTTDAAGLYEFTDLAPGVYGIRETQPSGLFHGGQKVGSLGGTVADDDLLTEITVSGGTHGSEYNFPEVPPATISGYVFQDGPALSTGTAPAPEDLRDYRDGIRGTNDKPIGNVRLELRNVLGQPFTADRALPGIYGDGFIQVTTDANGYYEFTGLRPGTYHVYEVQPEDYIDGLDTPGSTGGVAVNPADIPDDIELQFVVQTLSASDATDPGDDAILNVSLTAGGHSSENNFSEIIVLQPPPPLPPIDHPQAEVPQLEAGPLPAYDRVASFAVPLYTPRPAFYDLAYPVSWHLSVINGGAPREDEGQNGMVQKASSQEDTHFDESKHRKGRWSLVTRDGERLELSDAIMLGEEGAVPLSGDFDGDGRDEVAIFVGGQWFVDLNGNGIWDSGDLWISLGTELDRPVVGDWDADGKDDIGIFGREWLRDPQAIANDPGLPAPSNRHYSRPKNLPPVEPEATDGVREMKLSRKPIRADLIDHVFRYGQHHDTPVAGDWNGDAHGTVGVFRAGVWRLDEDGDGRWAGNDREFIFGSPGSKPVVGDWNGDGIDDLGVVEGDLWILDSNGDRKLTAADQRLHIPADHPDAQPIAGDWDGDGRDEPGWYHTGAEPSDEEPPQEEERAA